MAKRLLHVLFVADWPSPQPHIFTRLGQRLLNFPPMRLSVLEQNNEPLTRYAAFQASTLGIIVQPWTIDYEQHRAMAPRAALRSLIREDPPDYVLVYAKDITRPGAAREAASWGYEQAKGTEIAQDRKPLQRHFVTPVETTRGAA